MNIASVGPAGPTLAKRLTRCRSTGTDNVPNVLIHKKIYKVFPVFSLSVVFEALRALNEKHWHAVLPRFSRSDWPNNGLGGRRNYAHYAKFNGELPPVSLMDDDDP